VTGGGEVFDDLVLTFESGMVGTQVYAHNWRFCQATGANRATTPVRLS
jgi:hypothetical protein